MAEAGSLGRGALIVAEILQLPRLRSFAGHTRRWGRGGRNTVTVLDRLMEAFPSEYVDSYY